MLAPATAPAGDARAEDAAKPPPAHGAASASCAKHAKAMHDMKSGADREAYCRAHADGMSHNCGGMGTHGHRQTAPAPAKAEPKQPSR